METSAGQSGPARIVIVDDHDFVHSGVKAMLLGEPGLEIVGEAADGQEAIELCARERPDLVLMDVRMSQMDGLTATRSTRRPSIASLTVGG